jgi:hypothetical protein
MATSANSAPGLLVFQINLLIFKGIVLFLHERSPDVSGNAAKSECLDGIVLFLHERSPDVSGNADKSECLVSRMTWGLPDVQA